MLHLRDDDATDELVKVTGVFKNLPQNAHLKFDVLFSYNSLYTRGNWAIRRYKEGWRRKDMYTFIQLRPGTDPEKIAAGFPAIVDKYKPELKNSQQKEVLGLQSIQDIHLNSDLAEEAESNGNGTIVFFIGLIGVFVLVIAWINYINLSTARALTRAKEVGVRKVIGAFRHQLVSQFLTEAFLINILALAIAYGLVIVSLQYFNTISGLSLDKSYLYQPWFLVLIIMLWIVGSLLSGFYPAWVLSSFKPIAVLKGKLQTSAGESWVRKGLVVFQFAISAILIITVMVVYKQMQLVQAKNLGYNKDNIIHFANEGNIGANQQTFITELKRIPGVVNATNMEGDMLGNHSGGGGINWPGKTERIEFAGLYVDFVLREIIGPVLRNE